MSWILHVSDAHLGAAAEWQYLGDVKKPVIKKAEQLTTQGVLRSTLASLGRWDGTHQLDAVVFSGDITSYAREDGYQQFESLLAELGPLRPPNEHVVVVPGNHDVSWDAEPASSARYQLFLDYIRHAGYVTPLLDGIDLDSSGRLKSGHVSPVLQGDDFVIVAFNSSNYCGTQETPRRDDLDWEKTLRWHRRKVREQAHRELKRLRQHDIARISAEQMKGLERHLSDEGLAVSDGRLRIAVLHHHLLPLSTREEIKTFESVTNLGEVRLFLKDLGFRLVLHGHKHESALYWDHIQPRGDSVADPAHRMLVAASPGLFRHGDLTCRLFKVLPRAEYKRGARGTTNAAPILQIHDIEGKRRGEATIPSLTSTVPIWQAEMETAPTPLAYVYGESIDVVYERLQALLTEHADNEIHDVVCIIDSAGLDPGLPEGYPPTREADERAWFNSLVKWWQMKESRVLGRSKLLAFNHGERIYGWNGDALKRAAEALEHDPKTTRSLVILIDPRSEAGHEDVEYPAFVLAQLRVVTRERKPYVDVVGYFRKQDLRSWWPLNVAELAKLQREAMAHLRTSNNAIAQGRIVTYASTALVDDVLPALAVTRLDRSLDDEPDAVWRMAYSAVLHRQIGDPETELRLWQGMLAELRTDTPEDEPRIATVGLEELRDQLGHLKRINPAEGEDVYQHVFELAAAHSVLASQVPDNMKAQQRQVARTHVEALIELIEKRLGTPET